MREAERRKLDVFEMECLRSVWIDIAEQLRSKELRKRTQMERQLSGRVDQCVLWFEHVEGMDEEHMAKKVVISDVEGNRCTGRPWLGWMDGCCKDGF